MITQMQVTLTLAMIHVQRHVSLRVDATAQLSLPLVQYCRFRAIYKVNCQSQKRGRTRGVNTGYAAAQLTHLLWGTR